MSKPYLEIFPRVNLRPNGMPLSWGFLFNEEVDNLKIKAVSLILTCTLSLAPTTVSAKESVKKKHIPTYHVCDRRDNSRDALACNIYKESRGEGLSGMLAVGFVTLNRMDHDKFPSTVRGVIYQRSQFSWTMNKKGFKIHDKEQWQQAKAVADFLIQVKKLKMTYIAIDFTGGSTYYHTKKVHPYWGSHFIRTITVGNHIFYREKETT